MERSDHYDGHEHAIVKHAILGQYLQNLAYTIGSQGNVTLNYVDAFAGPWVSDERELSLDDDLSETSPYIAIRELLAARESFAQRGKIFAFRCMFIEIEADRARVLELALQRDFPGLDTCVINGSFEDVVNDVKSFSRTPAPGCPKTFGFVFIDPKGWVGFPMAALAQLTQGERYIELLINFMLSFLRRFVPSKKPPTRQTILDLYGPAMTNDRINEFAAIPLDERIDALVEEYRDALRETLGFEYSGTAMILHPEHDDRYYDLVYATRSLTGLRRFREAERSAMPAHNDARTRAHQRRTRAREAAGNQTTVFGLLGREDDVIDSSSSVEYVERQRRRALSRMQAALERFLAEHGECCYADLEARLLPYSLVYDRDIKGHLYALRDQGAVELDLPPKRRAPQPETRIRWLR